MFGEFSFGSYRPSMIPVLHEARIEHYQLSDKRTAQLTECRSTFV